MDSLDERQVLPNNSLLGQFVSYFFDVSLIFVETYEISLLTLLSNSLIDVLLQSQVSTIP